MAVAADIIAKHVSFNHIRQMTTICSLLNTWFLGLTEVCPQWHLDRQLFLHGSVVINTHTQTMLCIDFCSNNLHLALLRAI